MDERALGLKIKGRREELSLSQRDFATFLGIDQGRVSLIEKGTRRVDVIKELPLIAKFLKVPITWFFDDLGLQGDKTPTELLLEQYFPDKGFQAKEIEQIRAFIEKVLQAFIAASPDLGKSTTKLKKKSPTQATTRQRAIMDHYSSREDVQEYIDKHGKPPATVKVDQM